jgi:DNA-binding transcriptional LysR family regulator
MSATLGRLRALFGDPLLLRTAGGMLPTSKGQELVAPVRQVLAEIGRIVQRPERFDPALAERTFTIAASDYVEYAILPRLVDFLEARAPRARLAVRPMDFGTVGRQLEAGDVDLGILGAVFAPPTLRSRPLFVERFVCIVRKTHPRVGERFTLDDYCALDHVLVSPSGGAFAAPGDDALAALGRSRHVRLVVPHFLLVPEILTHSDMIAVLPERLARGYDGRFRVLDLPFDLPPFSVVAIWHERTHRDPALAWLRQSVADLMSDPAGAGGGPPARAPAAPPQRRRTAGRRRAA